MTDLSAADRIILFAVIFPAENCCLGRPTEISFVMRSLFFNQRQNLTGCAETELTAPAPLNREQFWAVPLQKHPGLRVHRGIIRPACNWKYAGKEMPFGHGDEVALIPPVSGG